MDELIRIDKSKGGKAVVSGRELHASLEIGTRMVRWMERMIEYGFVENKDYAVAKSENPVNQQVTIQDFVITLDMAKHIAMIQRTPQGMKMRNYFIDAEKKLSKVATIVNSDNKLLQKDYLDSFHSLNRTMIGVNECEGIHCAVVSKQNNYIANIPKGMRKHKSEEQSKILNTLQLGEELSLRNSGLIGNEAAQHARSIGRQMAKLLGIDRSILSINESPQLALQM